jgi:hypothetical protein
LAGAEALEIIEFFGAFLFALNYHFTSLSIWSQIYSSSNIF